jgi:hypothetical protein
LTISTACSTEPKAVMTITGASERRVRILFNNSSPARPGMRMSVMSRSIHSRSRSMCAIAARPSMATTVS